MKRLFIAALLLGTTLPAYAQTGAVSEKPAKVMARGDLSIPEQLIPGNVQTEPRLPVVTLKGAKPVVAGVAQHIALNLQNADHTPLLPENLRAVHDKKLRLLIVDRSLSDYQSVVPAQGMAPGDYYFSFVPKTGHDYTVWADIAPVGQSEIAIAAELPGSENCAAPCVDQSEAYEQYKNGYVFSISLDTHPIAGASNRLQIDITREDGELAIPARVRLAGFYTNGKGVTYLEPMAENTFPTQFHILPIHTGFMRFFAEMNLDGKNMTVPFGIVVEDPENYTGPLMANRGK